MQSLNEHEIFFPCEKESSIFPVTPAWFSAKRSRMAHKEVTSKQSTQTLGFHPNIHCYLSTSWVTTWGFHHHISFSDHFLDSKFCFRYLNGAQIRERYKHCRHRDQTSDLCFSNTSYKLQRYPTTQRMSYFHIRLCAFWYLHPAEQFWVKKIQTTSQTLTNQTGLNLIQEFNLVDVVRLNEHSMLGIKTTEPS